MRLLLYPWHRQQKAGLHHAVAWRCLLLSPCKCLHVCDRNIMLDGEVGAIPHSVYKRTHAGGLMCRSTTVAVCHRSPFVAAFIAFAIAQITKLFTFYYTENRWDFTRIVGSGGMPSSHTSMVRTTAGRSGHPVLLEPIAAGMGFLRGGACAGLACAFFVL